MKKQFVKRIKPLFFSTAILFFCTLFLMGCDKNPNPTAGTEVTTTSPEFLALAKQMNPLLDCKRIDCCFLDGVETSCAFVNSCLESGLCVLAKK